MANTVISFYNNISDSSKKEPSAAEIYTDISRQSVTSTKYRKNLLDDTSSKKNIGYSSYDFKVSKSVNIQAVANAIHNIFEFFPGERVLYPDFGSRLRMYLYNGITQYNQEQIVAEVYSNLEMFDSRVVVDDIVIETSNDDKDDNTVVLRILYHIDGLPDSHYSYEYSYITT